MSDVLLTGATGVLGEKLLQRLRETHHNVLGVSRSPPARSDVEWVELDLTTDEGIADAVAGVDIIVHAASDARGDSEAVDVRGTERLLDAAADADVRNFVYVSIVGIDEIPYSYYQHKHTAERTIEANPVPSTTVRITQFYPFVAYLLGSIRKLPVWPLPTRYKLQPIDPGEAADAVVQHVTDEPSGRVPNIGGPDVLSVRELAETYRAHLGVRRPIIRLPIPGRVSSAFRAGTATCPDRTIGTISWTEWLAEQEGIPGRDIY